MPQIIRYKYDLKDRTLNFAAAVGRFVYKLPSNNVLSQYAKQLIRSSSSVGANLQEADGAISRKDFVNKIAIARKEARETYYWLSLIQKSNILETDFSDIAKLTQEAKEFILILSSIINKIQALK